MPTAAQRLNTFRNIQDLLSHNGIPSPVNGYAAAAVMHETGDLTSRVSQADKNYSGIKWINKPYQKATKGSPAPKGEGGGFYARYTSVPAWAQDYARILKLGPGRPDQAKSIQDFAARLKANRYFTDNPANYARGVQNFYNKYAGNAVKADNALNTARADTYQKQAEVFKNRLQNDQQLSETLKKIFTKRNILIGAGVFILIKVASR